MQENIWMKKDNRSSFSLRTVCSNEIYLFSAWKLKVKEEKKTHQKKVHNFSLCKFDCSKAQNNRLIKVSVQTYALYIRIVWKEREQWWWTPKKRCENRNNEQKKMYKCSSMTLVACCCFLFGFLSHLLRRKQKTWQKTKATETTTESWVCLILNNFEVFFVLVVVNGKKS